MESKKNHSAEERAQIRELDGIIPEGIDRRKFLTASLAAATGLVAGCTGDTPSTQTTSATEATETNAGDSATTSTGSETIVKNVVWRQPWKPNPSYSLAYAAQLNGFWEEEDISAPTVRKGFGSGDTVKRVMTGKENLGMASISPQITALSEGEGIKIYGIGKARAQYSLIYRKDRMDSGTDLADKTVLITSALSKQQWPLYESAVDVPESLNVKFSQEATSAALLAQGEVDATWTGIYSYADMQDVMPDGVELGVTPLYSLVPTYGFTLIANGEWMNESNNLEYATRVLEGYSNAAKWAFMHPEQTIEIMRSDVNQALQVTEKEVLIEQFKAGVIATNLTDGIRDNGLGYLNEEVLSSTIDLLSNAIGIESPPSIENVADFRPQENADLATFSSDEWSQVQEYAQPYTDMFES